MPDSTGRFRYQEIIVFRQAHTDRIHRTGRSSSLHIVMTEVMLFVYCPLYQPGS